jgi:hypothetical protein
VSVLPFGRLLWVALACWGNTVVAQGPTATPTWGMTRVRHSVNQSVTASGLTLAFDTVDRDDGLQYFSSLPRQLTAQYNGWYEVTCQVVWAAVATAVGYRQLSLTKNASSVVGFNMWSVSTALPLAYQEVNTTLYLVAGDYVQCTATETGSSAVNVVAGNDYSPVFTMIGVSPNLIDLYNGLGETCWAVFLLVGVALWIGFQGRFKK